MTIETRFAELQAQGISAGADPLTVVDHPDGGRTLHLPTPWLLLSQAPGSTEVRTVIGAILGGFMDGGGLEVFGYPLTDEIVWTDDASRASVFQRGAITWRPETGLAFYWDKLDAFLQRAAWVAEQLIRMSPDDAKRRVAPPAGQEWCGYTLAHIYNTAGMDKSHAALFPSTQGLLDFGAYYGLDIYGAARNRARITKLKATGQDIREAHEARGSLRKVTLWPDLQSGAPLDIRPGDIVLVDHLRAGGPDHIQIAVGWDEATRFLTVVDGNGGGFVSREAMRAANGGAEPVLNVHYVEPPAQLKPGQGVSSAERQRLLREVANRDVLLPVGGSGRVSISGHLLTAAAQINPHAPTATNPHGRVFAIIRPSAMDFEEHDYAAI